MSDPDTFWARGSPATCAPAWKEYEDVHRSYGPRSYLYAEMVFGNTFIVNQLMTSTSQVAIHAMRTSGPISLPRSPRGPG